MPKLKIFMSFGSLNILTLSLVLFSNTMTGNVMLKKILIMLIVNKRKYFNVVLHFTYRVQIQCTQKIFKT